MLILSGAAGLVYETALQRELSRVFGATAWAAATVLAAFMGGTALGALALGWFTDRARSPLRFYAGLEIGIGACALLTPAAGARLNQLFLHFASGTQPDAPSLKLLRIALSFLFLLIPTALMGGTLPAASRGIVALAAKEKEDRAGDTGEADAGNWVARLYMANLFGAAAGAFLATYELMPALGLSTALAFGAALNLVAATVALLLSSGAISTAPTPTISTTPVVSTESSALTIPTVTSASTVSSASSASTASAVSIAPAKPVIAESRALGALLLLAAAWSGFASFAYEVVWTQLLSLVVGNSVYAFGLMLGVFLTGLMLGAIIAERALPGRTSWRVLGGVQLAASTLVVLTLPLWGYLPSLFALAGPRVQSFAGRELVRAAACVAVVGLPAIPLGVFYPLLLRRAGEQREKLGSAVGGLSAVNTLAAVAGSLCAGFLLLPWLGSFKLLTVLTAAGAFVAALCLADAPKRQSFALLLAFVVGWLPAWDLGRLANGENVYFKSQPWSQGKMLFSRESVESGVTTVSEFPPGSGHVILLTNGKFQGNDTGEVVAQVRFAELPLLVRHPYGRALNIGVGTGCSLAALAAQPFETVEAAEISHDIVAAARQYFGKQNFHVLDDERVKIHYADGRNLLSLSPTRYDLITVELTSIWIAGEADLYNREFYRLVKSRLGDGGLLQQWVQLHHISRRDLAVVLSTIQKELPHVALFAGGSQGQILASAQPLTVDYPAVAALSERLAGTPATAFIPGGDILSIYGELLLDEAGVSRYIADVAREEGLSPEALLSTDDNLRLEYATPKGNLMADRGELVKSLRSLPRGDLLIAGGEAPGAAEHIEAARRIGVRNKGRVDELLEQAIARGAKAAPLRTWFQEAMAEEARQNANSGN